MSKVTLAFGSFIVGAICGSFALSLIHTSTWVQASQAPQEPTLPPSTVTMPAAIPVVPPLQYFGVEGTVGGRLQQLDGFSCERCTVTVPILTYGGGLFNLPGSKLPRNVVLHLTGAALNTFNLLRATGAIPNPAPLPHVPPPGAAIQRATLEIKAQSSPLDLVSLEGAKK
jgi:hypothetical protein